MKRLRSSRVALLLCASALVRVDSYRVLSSISDSAAATRAVFEPYVKGNVGYYGDPANPDPERVNEGGPFSPDTPRIYMYGTPKQNCPGMVGPIKEDEYYCHGREYGYCDRRSGLCVCNQGYTGIDCTDCKPSYFKKGNLCYPKKSCPKDCSSAGVCDYETGTCACALNRGGSDCAQVYCHFDPKCTSCTASKCLSCLEGYYVDPSTQTCVSCKKYDPRCLTCSSSRCLQCADPLLNSVRRSGARSVDQPLPFDELNREFSFKFSYGSQDPRVFDEAEAFELVQDNATPKYLNESSVGCVQGQNLDASWSCKPNPVSHRVCGHAGVFSFTAPNYAVPEHAQNITLTVQRSGGGMGTASVLYELQHITTNGQDVSPTAFYTSTQVLTFAPGVVNMSFFLSVHDDHVVEGNETFRVLLRSPSDGSSLGNQREAFVTIYEDDAAQTDASTTAVVVGSGTNVERGGYAGDTLSFRVQAGLGDGSLKTKGGDIFLMESFVADESIAGADLVSLYRPRLAGTTTDHANGSYSFSWTRKHAGVYTVSVYLLYAGGLQGDYFPNAWLSGPPAISRQDRQLNFTWNHGPLFPGASDYVSVRWSGRLKSRATGDVTLYVACDDHVRLWIGDVLLLDYWSAEHDGGVDVKATVALDSSVYYSIIVEYRDLRGAARLSLSWSGAAFAKEVIPAAYLYTAQHIKSSPISNVVIQPALTASAATSYLHGSFATVAGTPLVLHLFPVDVYGNARKVFDPKLDLYTARLSVATDLSLGGIGSKTVDCDFQWRATNATFTVTCTPFFSGSHSLNVFINGVLLAGSPFSVAVSPNKMHPIRSVLSGVGLTNSRTAGAPTSVLLEARDLHKNRLYSSTDIQTSLLTIRAIHTTRSGVFDRGNVVDNADGTFTLTYTPRFVGAYLVHVTQNGVHIHNSPYTVTVVPNAAVGPTSVATGAGLSAATTNVQASFQIQSRDLNANDLTAGGATYQVIVEHETKGNATGVCSDLLNSRYSCTYTPKYVGVSKLHVGLLAGSVFSPLASSPFSLPVVAGQARGSLCLASGASLVSSIAGRVESFTVRMRDYFDNDKANAGSETITVSFVGPAPSTTTVPAADTGVHVSYASDGIFHVSYRLKTKGSYKINVSVDGTAIQSSPFSMYTYPAAASHLTTSIDLVSPVVATPVVYSAGTPVVARITTRDEFSNELESGGYLFEFDAAFTDQRLVAPVSLTDEKNGRYLFTFTPLVSQTYPLAQRIMHPGGLNATFYQSPDLVGTPTAQRIEPTIDFDFGLYPPLDTSESRTFSIQWSGFILPRFSEIYTIHVTINGGARLRIGDQALFPTLWPHATNAKASQQIVLSANTLMPLELNFSKSISVHNASIRVEWESLSQRREVLPSTRLFTFWTFVNNVPTLAVVPGAPASASYTTVFPGSSFSEPNVATAVAGEVFEFVVTARDRFRNIQLAGGDSFFVLFPGLNGASDITATVVDYSDARYKISIAPKLTGDFEMAIAATRAIDNVAISVNKATMLQNIQPYLIEKSPFMLRVVPNKPLATTSTLIGDGIVSAVAGIASSFVVELRDVHSNLIQRRIPSSQITVRLRLVADPQIGYDATFADAVDGLLAVSYVAYHTGMHEIMLSVLDGVAVSKLATLRVYPNLASALTSTDSGPGLGPHVQANVQLTYQIDLRDVYRNPKEVGGNDLAVVIRGPAVVYGDVIDLSNGNYMVQYTLPLPGAYEIQHSVANPGNGLVGYYFDSTRYTAVDLTRTLHWVDPRIDFDWTANETMRNYPRVQWRGYLKPKFTERYKLTLIVSPAAAVYIDEVPIIDALNLPSASSVAEGAVDLVGGRAHRIVVEYRSPSRQDVRGFLQLKWRSDRQPVEVIPTTALLPDGQELQPRYQVVAS